MGRKGKIKTQIIIWQGCFFFSTVYLNKFTTKAMESGSSKHYFTFYSDNSSVKDICVRSHFHWAFKG